MLCSRSSELTLELASLPRLWISPHITGNRAEMTAPIQNEKHIEDPTTSLQTRTKTLLQRRERTCQKHLQGEHESVHGSSAPLLSQEFRATHLSTC